MSPWRAAARASLIALLALGAPALGGTTARAQDSNGLAPVPAFHGYVNDQAGVIGGERSAQLESFLDQVHQKTGVQFAVLTVASSAPEDPSQFKTRVFNAWGIGDKERRDGLLLLVSIQERKLYFETGYGLEGTLPDGWQARMLRDVAIPEFRAGRPADGITAAVLAASQRIAAEKDVKLEWNGHELRYGEGGSGGTPTWMVILFVMLFIVFPILTARSRFRRRGGWYGGGFGGWGGGFGGFGGGFGGGGGGSSFGGFGGGSSGGGGGGAGW